MLSISGSTKVQMQDVSYDLDYIKVAEEPSTLVDQIPIMIFERKNKKSKKLDKTVNLSSKKKQNIKTSIKNKKLDKPLDPLSPFAILKSMKIK